MRQGSEPTKSSGAIAVPAELQESLNEALAAGERAAMHRDPATLNASLDAWVAVTRHEGFGAAPPDFHAAVFNSRGLALEQRYKIGGAPTDLDASIAAFQEALEAVPAASSFRPGYLSNLGNVMSDRYARTGVIADLEAAITAFEGAVAATPADSADRPMYLYNLGNGLGDRYDRGRMPADLEATIAAYREAVETSPAESPQRSGCLTNLGNGLYNRYEVNGALADLDEAIAAYRAAVDATPADAPHRPTVLNNLGIGLTGRYTRTGNVADLDAAIANAEETLKAIPVDSPDRPGYLLNLGTDLRDRYARTGALSDLEAGITAYQQALDAVPADSPDRPRYVGNVGTGLRDRYRRTKDPADLEAAISAHREALETTPLDASNRRAILNDLGIDLSERHDRTGFPADLDEAISAYEAAIQATPADAPIRLMYVNNLATGLRDRYRRNRSPADLEAAIAAHRQVVEATPPDAPDRPGYLGNLGNVLRARYVLNGDAADLEAAIDAYRQASMLGLTLAPAVTLSTAQTWGLQAGEREAWDEAVEAYTYGLAAIDQLYATQLMPGAKQAWLQDAQGVAATAAYAMAKTGDVPGAFLALERGRARLLTEAIQRDRADMADVATRDPAAYEAYQEAASQLRSLERQERAVRVARPETETSAVPAGDIQDQARRARAELEAAVGRIQQVPGHAGFGRPPTFDEVAAIAEPGWPLVALVATAAGSLALVVARADRSVPPTVEAIWAPDLTAFVLDELLVKVEDGRVVGGYLAGQLVNPEWLETSLVDDLPRLGANLVGSVAARLRELQATGVVLLPTGMLSMFPLHAAPYAVDGGTRCLLDEFDVSYTPGALILGVARATLAAREAQPAVLVGVGNPQPHPQPLAFARAELEEVARFFPDGASHALYETAATETAFVDLLPQATHVHLACHGRFDADTPLDSCIELARPEVPAAGDEGRLRLEEIMANDWFGHCRLVVLSACQTAMTDPRRLPDEAIGLPAGLLQAGVPGVIGTLWSVDDLSTTLLMTQFYAYHRQGDPATGEGPLAPAAALRRAQGWLKTRTADDLVTLLAGHRSMAAAAEQRRGTRMSATEAGAGLRQLGLEDPDSRPFADPWYWASFVAIGA